MVETNQAVVPESTYQKLINVSFTTEDLSRTFYAGIEIITIVQLFNWFSAKYNGTILFTIMLVGPLAFFMQFAIGGYFHCFPDMPYYLSTDPPATAPSCGIFFNTGFE
jgi:hypothetical protein